MAAAYAAYRIQIVARPTQCILATISTCCRRVMSSIRIYASMRRRAISPKCIYFQTQRSDRRVCPVTRTRTSLIFPPLHGIYTQSRPCRTSQLQVQGCRQVRPMLCFFCRAVADYPAEKVPALKLCAEPVLELVRDPLAGVGRAKHGTQCKACLLRLNINVVAYS